MLGELGLRRAPSNEPPLRRSPVARQAPPSFWRSFGVALMTYVLVVAAISAFTRTTTLVLPRAEVLDYRVMACAERVVIERGDVYRTAALRDCEHRLAPEADEPPWSVTPFALPPYSAALLVPFGAIDFQAGRALWFALQILAVGAIVAALAQIVARPAFAIGLVVIPTFGLVNIFYGETVLLATAAAALGALALTRNRPVLAALAVTLSFLEPAIGLPCAVGLFALVPSARRTLAAGLAVLAVLGVLVLGFPATVEYVLKVIPAHDRSEIFARDQYSLTRLAFVLGAGERTAAALGSISYLAMVALGVAAARSLGARLQLPALYLLLPLALSVLGGPFVHDYEVAAAILVALLLARDSRIARVSVALLTIVWGARWQHNVLPAFAGAAGVALLYLDAQSLGKRAGYVAAVTCALLALNVALPKSPARSTATVGSPQPAVAAGDLSSVPWEWRIRLTPALSTIDRANELEKIPFWFAVSCLPFVLAGSRKREPPARATAG